MTLIAIDPGKSGGIASMNSCGEVQCVPMPETDGDILDYLRLLFVSGHRDCHIEHVCGFVGGAGAGQMFEFGKGFGFILGCLMTLGYRIHLHRPQKWQKALSLGQKKDHGKKWKNHLKNRAQQLFPQCEVTLKTADALLILEYARKLNLPAPTVELEYFQELTGEKRESELAEPACSPAREKIKTLGLATCYLRTAANFTERGWLKEAYMEAEHAQRLLKDVIDAKPENS